MPDQALQITTPHLPFNPLVPAVLLVGRGSAPSRLEDPFPVVLYSSERDSAPKCVAVTWAQLAAQLATHERRTDKSGPSWSPIVINGPRASANVRAMTAGVLDLDDGADLKQVRATIAREQVRAIIHSTHSHTADAPRARLVVALSRPVTPMEWPSVWRALVELYGSGAADRACSDVARLYYLPSAPDGAPVIAESYDGMPVDVDTIIARAPVIIAPVAPRALVSVPAVVSDTSEDDAMRAAEILAAAWPSKGRHVAQLALTGALARAGWTVESIAGFCGAVAELHAGNAEESKRHDVARMTVEKYQAGENVTGWPTLIKLVGEAPVRDARRMLGMRDAITPDPAFVSTMTALAVVPNAVDRAIAVATELVAHAATSGPLGLAQAFVRSHATHPDGVTLRRWRGDWWRWVDGRYMTISDETVDRDLYRGLQLDNRRAVGDARAALIAVDDVLIDGADIGTWIGEPTIAGDPLDIAACPNGLVNLYTGQLAPATPRYFATSVLGVAYDANAAEPVRWLAFLRALWPDDAESIAALQEWMGYMLTPDTRQQKILLLVGPKRSGKGTIMRVLTALLNPGSIAAPTLASLATNFGLWPLIGKSAAIIGDARLSGRTDVAQVVERLLSISGQDPQTVDRKHREPWTGYLSTRVTVVTNELPRFQDPSGALAGRLIALQLSRSWFGKEDTTLTDVLLAELPGILLWAIEGWRRMRERGHLVQPTASADLIGVIEDLGSNVTAWCRDRCEVGADHVIPKTAAYESHRGWCLSQGHPVPSSSMFGRDLTAAGYASVKPRVDGVQVAHYSGLRLKPS